MNAYGLLQRPLIVGALLCSGAAASADSRFPDCRTGPFYLFFEWNSSEIMDDGLRTIEKVVAARTWCGPNVKILVEGYADRSQTSRASQKISKARAIAVMAKLRELGVSDQPVFSKGYGEKNLRILTDDGVREFQNRRVEVRFVLPKN